MGPGSCALAILLLAGAAGPPLRVAVAPAPAAVPPEDREAFRHALAAKVETAEQAERALRRVLRNRYGNRPQGWPADKRAALLELRAEGERAQAVASYLDQGEGARAALARDLAETLAGSAPGLLALVAEPEGADLVVEVVGRRSGRSSAALLRPDVFFLCVDLRAGGRRDPARLSRVPAGWRPERPAAVPLSAFTGETPFLRYEVEGRSRRSNAVRAAALFVRAFVLAHRDLLAEEPPK